MTTRQHVVPLIVRWCINPDHSVTLSLLRSEGTVPRPIAEVTLSAKQIVRLQTEQDCHGEGLVWTEESPHA